MIYILSVWRIDSDCDWYYGKKGLLNSFPHCVLGKWTEEQGPELSYIPVSIYALGYCALYYFMCAIYGPVCGLCQSTWAY